MANSDYTTKPGSFGFCPVGFLTADLGYLDTEIVMTGYTSPIDNGIRIGMAAMIGTEIVVIEARDGNNLTIGRGTCDTLPQEHDAGDPIWFFDDSLGYDSTEYGGQQEVAVKPLVRRSGGPFVPVAHSTPVDVKFNSRFVRPYPPGSLKVNGFRWFTGGFVLDGDNQQMEFTWKHRDRVTQQDQLVSHDEDSIGPEDGVTYTAKIYEGDVLLAMREGITGHSWDYTLLMAAEDFSSVYDVHVAHIIFTAQRGDFDSFQQYRVDFTLTMPEQQHGLGFRLGLNLGKNTP